MKARLCLFIALIAFAGSACADYYLVYPAYAPCCVVQKHYVRHARHKTYAVKKKYYATRYRRSYYRAEVYYPSYVSACNSCGSCGGCGYPQGYVVYTGRPDGCVTYQEEYYNAYRYPPSAYPPESVTYSY